MSFAVLASIFEKRFFPSQGAGASGIPRWVPLSTLLAALLVSGCAGPVARQAGFPTPFAFGTNTFAYRNDLVWVYYRDPDTGRLKHQPRQPAPDYTHHCFVMARSARQFFQHARFDPALPRADAATYRERVRAVISASPRKVLATEDRVVIPGYTNLFEFSRAWEALLKAECGGAWQSYFQRGHWRMVLPFFRSQQRSTAQSLAESIRRNRPPVVHLVRFPQLTINHAVVLFGVEETERELRFAVYDPYDPQRPAQLIFDRHDGQFQFPGNDYFVGGKLNAYEVYCSWRY